MDYYPDSGFMKRITDPLGHWVEFEYDGAGRLLKQTFSDGREIAYEPDGNGNVVSLTPPGRPAHGFDYTPVDLLERYRPPALGGMPVDTVYFYKRDRQLELVTRPEGLKMAPVYDVQSGRLGQVSLPDGRSLVFDYLDGIGDPNEAKTGQVREILVDDPLEPNVSLSYTYDGFLVEDESWDGFAHDVKRIYNNDLRIETIQIDENFALLKRILLGYDDDGLLVNMSMSSPNVSLTLIRDAGNGLVTGSETGEDPNNKIITTRSYNGFGELASIIAKSVSGSEATLYEAHYATADNPRDALGRIVDLDETIQGEHVHYHYVYDEAGRLSDVAKEGHAYSHYDYDSNGNRTGYVNHETGQVIDSTQIVTDDQDRLLKYGDVTYGYTPNGELASKTVNGETTTYTYDVLGNLTDVYIPGAEPKHIHYIIDGRSRRIGKEVNGQQVWGLMYIDQLNPVAELEEDASGNKNIVSIFVYGSRLNVPDFMVSNKVTDVNPNGDWRTYRVISNHLGSVRLVVDTSSGVTVQRMDYDEFGNVLNDTNTGFQPFGFAGGLYDYNTNLVRLGARDYNPQTGYWTKKDPAISLGIRANRYQYNISDPINRIDPFGYFDFPVGPNDGTVIYAKSAGSTIKGIGNAIISGIYTIPTIIIESIAFYMLKDEPFKDHFQHCLASCIGAEWSPGSAVLMGIVKEILDNCFGGVPDLGDLVADQVGISSAINGVNCYDSCSRHFNVR